MSSAPHIVLGVRPDAGPEEIRSAWRALVRRSHPDLLGNSVTAEQRMKAINAAHDAMLEALVRARETAARDRSAPAARPSRPVRRSPPGRVYPPRPCPPPERPFAAPRRMVPDTPTQMRMRAALARCLRQILNRETARLGGAAYSVPGQREWRDDDAVFARGGLPATCLVDRIDFNGRRVALRLGETPRGGRVLVAFPRLLQDGPQRIRRDGTVQVLAVTIPDPAAGGLLLSAEDTARVVCGAHDLTARLVFPD